jgi:Bacterial membrane protein YfhO
LSLAALVYTTGWLLGVARYVPGFDFFQGPGRYGVITTLGVAILAAKALDHWRNTGSLLLGIAVLISFGAAMWTALALTWQGLEMERAANGGPNPFQLGPFVFSEGMMSGLLLLGLIALILAVVAQLLNHEATLAPPARVGRWTLVACVLVTTVVDLWLVSRVVTYSNMVGDPPINHLANSPVRQFLGARTQPSRVFAPGANLPSALAAATPVYLTFGPVEYVDPKLVMPQDPLSARIEWLRRAGVTHVLSFNPLNEAEWPVRSVWQGFDPLLNPAWARYREPLYLYELRGSRGRVAWEKPAVQPVPQVTELSPSRITIDADSSPGGRLILTELMYPGWQVAIDGKQAQPLTIERMFRGVDVPSGRHQVVWSYHPRSLYWGLAVSALTLLLLAAVAHVAYWHPERLKLAAEDSPQ